MNPAFWKDKVVLVTGNTGFKGTWLTLLLKRFGAKVYGYSISTPTDTSLFKLTHLDESVTTCWKDVRDYEALRTYVHAYNPRYVIHMAAQAIVKDGYAFPRYTFDVNVMGTVNLLQSCLDAASIFGVLVVTTDKVYGEGYDTIWGFRETDPMKAADPYSTSKAMAELATQCYGNTLNGYWGRVNTARAGNVIGFGDFAHRMIPMTMEALMKNTPPPIWDASAVRPWQSVLDCLNGYLTLLEEQDNHNEGGWNFGPNPEEELTVGEVVDKICELWGGPYRVNTGCPDKYTLDITLRLDSYKSRRLLGWKPRWSVDKTLEELVRGYRAYKDGVPAIQICEDTLDAYLNTETN